MKVCLTRMVMIRMTAPTHLLVSKIPSPREENVLWAQLRLLCQVHVVVLARRRCAARQHHNTNYPSPHSGVALRPSSVPLDSQMKWFHPLVVSPILSLGYLLIPVLRHPRLLQRPKDF
jgi:hypothetical protein